MRLWKILRKRRLSGDTAPQEDDAPSTPVKKDPPKPAAEEPTPKREGVDLGAIMEELRQKRLRGESGEESDEPAKTPEPVKKPEPEVQKPSEPPAKKSDDGVDLGAIMQELRERRMRGDQGDGDAKPACAEIPVTKPAPQPVVKTASDSAGEVRLLIRSNQQHALNKDAGCVKTSRQIKTTELALGTTIKRRRIFGNMKYLLENMRHTSRLSLAFSLLHEGNHSFILRYARDLY